MLASFVRVHRQAAYAMPLGTQDAHIAHASRLNHLETVQAPTGGFEMKEVAN
jgi:hypothetical protein